MGWRVVLRVYNGIERLASAHGETVAKMCVSSIKSVNQHGLWNSDWGDKIHHEFSSNGTRGLTY